jgi:hypothetical protein
MTGVIATSITNVILNMHTGNIAIVLVTQVIAMAVPVGYDPSYVLIALLMTAGASYSSRLLPYLGSLNF